MQKYYLNNLLNDHIIKVGETETKTAVIYYLPRTNQILKFFRPEYLFLLKINGIDMEEKILISETLNMSSEIIKPTGIVYDNNGNFIAYTMPYQKEKNYNQWENDLTLADRENLQKYAKIHCNLEKIVKASPDIVMPDLCSCDNILAGPDDTIKLIDYDGLQTKHIPTPSISSSLGDQLQYVNSPKYYQNKLFTKELDKKSLIILYFFNVFNVDLNKIGTYNPFTKRPVSLEEIFYQLNLFDYDFNHKVWKLFNEKEPNDYLGKDMFRIADKYNMIALKPSFPNSPYLKKLIKK